MQHEKWLNGICIVVDKIFESQILNEVKKLVGGIVYESLNLKNIEMLKKESFWYSKNLNGEKFFFVFMYWAEQPICALINVDLKVRIIKVEDVFVDLYKGTVLDGEIVEEHYYINDVLYFKGEDVKELPFSQRYELRDEIMDFKIPDVMNIVWKEYKNKNFKGSNLFIPERFGNILIYETIYVNFFINEKYKLCLKTKKCNVSTNNKIDYKTIDKCDIQINKTYKCKLVEDKWEPVSIEDKEPDTYYFLQKQITFHKTVELSLLNN